MATPIKHISAHQLYPCEKRCAVCDKEITTLCTQRRSIYCCETDCQRADYSLHKLLCKAWANPALAPKTVVQSGQFGVDPNEAPEGRRAIYFHAGESMPRMTLLPRAILRGWPREIISLLGDGKGGHGFTHVEMKVANGERLPYTLEIFTVGTPKKYNLPANAGLVRATRAVAPDTTDAAQATDAVPWRGLILIRCIAHPSHHRHSYLEDMILADFHNAIPFMEQRMEDGLTEDASHDLPRPVDTKTVKTQGRQAALQFGPRPGRLHEFHWIDCGTCQS